MQLRTRSWTRWLHTARRRAWPGTSIAWGLWERTSELTASLGESDVARLARAGVLALSDEQSLEVFDRAHSLGEPLLLGARLDIAALRAQARTQTIPPLLRGLIRAPTRRASDSGPSLAARLATAPENEREGIVLDLVRTEVATTLGHTSAEAIDAQKTFKELGFDSLAAIELRNRLNTTTGLQLSTTLIFDHPTPTTLTHHLLKTAVPAVGKQSSENLSEANIRQIIGSIPDCPPSRGWVG